MAGHAARIRRDATNIGSVDEIKWELLCSCGKSFLMLDRRLDVHPLRHAFLLAVQHILLGLLEVIRVDLHATLAQRHQACLGADCLKIGVARAFDGDADAHLDVGTAQIILAHNELFEVDIGRQRHAASVDVENATLGLLVWQWELNLAVNAPCSTQSRNM